MEANLVLLFISAAVKTVVLILIATFLMIKWFHQKLRYFMDFPFLNALGFYIFSLGKILDIFLYYHFIDTPNLATINDPVAILLARIRFILSPILVVLPYFILMLVIWLEDRKKLQKSLGIGWIVLSLIAVLLAKNYKQFLIFNMMIALPVIVLSIVSFAIIHHQHRLPQINSLFITIGWCVYFLTQIIRPIWISVGNSAWGLTWIGEFLELLAMMTIGLGFLKPAFYSEKILDNTIKRNVYNDGIYKNRDESIEDVEYLEKQEDIDEENEWKYNVECYIP